MENLKSRLAKRSERSIGALGIMMVLALLLLNEAAGAQVFFSLYGLIPVCLVTWFAGLRAGVVMSLVSATLWLAPDLMETSGLLHPFLAQYNAGVSLGVFLILTVLISRLRAQGGGWTLRPLVHARVASANRLSPPATARHSKRTADVMLRQTDDSGKTPETLTRQFLAGFVVVGLLLLGVLNYLVGPDVFFAVYCLLPVCLATWFAGRRAGMLASIASATTWLVTDMMEKSSLSHPFVSTYNAGVSLCVFLAVAFLLSQLRARRAHLEEMLKDSTTILHAEVAVRARNEKELQHSREQSRLILETAFDGFVAINADGAIIEWNRQAEIMFGWPRSEALGRLLVATIIPPQHREAHRKGLQEFLVTGKAAMLNTRVEWTALHRDGREFPVETAIRPLRIGENVTFNAFLRDLTEKKKLEAQFLRAQRLESIGTLAGGIAHDLNNVLAPIMMVVQTLKRKLPDEQSQQMLGMLSSSVQRGADIVRQVLSFARGVEEKRVEVQIKHVILEIEKFLQETFPKSIEIGRRVPANLWAVTADVTQLHQVFMNLCVNARDAMPNGGRLTLGAENLLLDETSARGHPDAKPGEYVVITVTDTGTGIPPDIINKMFEPFFTTKDFGKGTGIGLSTVAGIVKNHGGFVSVESETGKGSRFKVHLPKSGAPIKTAPPVEDSEFPAGHGELILLADDEAAIREITRGTLESYGYRVITVNDGAEAVARYVEHQKEIQLVLTDMMMPFMDGAATIRALRKMNRSLKIIACGGLMDESCDLSEREIAGVNVHAFLRKPFTAEKLLRSVNHVIRMGPF